MQRTYRAIVIATLGIGLAVAPSAVHATCVGDCGGTGSVQINDLILMVNIALEKRIALHVHEWRCRRFR